MPGFHLSSIRLWALWLALITLSILPASCSPAAASPGSLPTSPGPALASPTAAPSATPHPTETAQPSPTASNTPTAAPSATPTQPPTATALACWQQPGRTERSTLRSTLLTLPMEYTVHLPPCYDQQPERRYPVLYMIHGQNYNNDQWERLGIFETADALAADGELPPFIIVLPRDRSWAQPTEDFFGQVVADELVPLIDRRYRTLPERQYRAVGGLSRGAGWAVHLGLNRRDLFSALGAHSLPVFHTDARSMRTWLEEIPPEEMPRIYLDIGDKDRYEIMRSAVWFEELLTTYHVPHEWRLNSGYHEEAYWRAHLEEYLRWYAAEW